MPYWKNADDNIIVNAMGHPIKCDDCPCGGVSVCDAACDWPDTFDVEATNWLDLSCSSCESILNNVLVPVTYQGEFTITDGTFEHWQSADDVFGSPGDCSGDFDNKTYHVLVQPFAGSCRIFGYCWDDGESVDQNVNTQSGFAFQAGLVSSSICTGTPDLIISSAVQVKFAGCNVPSFPFDAMRIHPNG